MVSLFILTVLTTRLVRLHAFELRRLHLLQRIILAINCSVVATEQQITACIRLSVPKNIITIKLAHL